MRRNYIIFADPFDEDRGGTIVLHRLCDLLNQEGQRAYLWPFEQPMLSLREPLRSPYRWFRHRFHPQRSQFRTFDRFTTPIARRSDIGPGSIVVYPEIVEGNPLQARNVVRWLLHKPGFHTGNVRFGAQDRIFYFQDAFNDPKINPLPHSQLRTTFIRDDIYIQENFGARSGSCYIVRKGKGRALVHDLADSVLVDGLSHKELAAVFNRVNVCVSYDPYTLYSAYAALCGCTSVVVPIEGVSIDEWYPDPADRYGVAYGFDDIPRATATQHLLLPRLKAQEAQSNSSVKSFIAQCEAYFGDPQCGGRGRHRAEVVNRR